MRKNLNNHSPDLQMQAGASFWIICSMACSYATECLMYLTDVLLASKCVGRLVLTVVFLSNLLTRLIDNKSIISLNPVLRSLLPESGE